MHLSFSSNSVRLNLTHLYSRRYRVVPVCSQMPCFDVGTIATR